MPPAATAAALPDRPRVLDLFCGAGGAARGLQRAGFHVTGVDCQSQPRYAGDVFVQGDALAADLAGYDLVWASPPCQRYSVMSACRPGVGASYPDLVGAVRDRLLAWGGVWIIENVPGSPLHRPVTLCGTMFGLPLYRHRWFEASFPVAAPAHTRHVVRGGRAGHWKPGQIVSVCGNCAPIALARSAMGIDWMRRSELAEAIPPAYSEYLGRLALAWLGCQEVA